MSGQPVSAGLTYPDNAGSARVEPLVRAHADDRGRTYDYEVLIVAYYSRQLIEKLLASMPTDLPIAIVDNSRGADGLGEAVAERPNTRYLIGPGRGFGAGVNRGVMTSEYDIVALVNPDSSPSVDQLDSLAAEVRGDPRMAFVTTITSGPDGRIDIGIGGWEPSVRRAWIHAVGAHKIFPKAGLWARPVPGRPIELDWLCGTCSVVSRRHLVELGGLDESFFLYSEDVQLGRDIREAGLRQKV